MNIRGLFRVCSLRAVTPAKTVRRRARSRPKFFLMVQLQAIPLLLAPPRNGVTTAI